MFGLRSAVRKPARDDAEKPFWISFSDLMTALMVLFLIAMAVALMSITQKVVSGPAEHGRKIEACMVDVASMTMKEFPGVEIKGHVIGFGTLALFDTNKNILDSRAESTLRSYVPRILNLVRSPKCKTVFKRVTVEGFASRSGTYIHNLNLSLQRAERVLCVLLDPSARQALIEADRKLVRGLFLVGGSSFNSLKESDAESQRIELKLEFLAYGDRNDEIRDAPAETSLVCPL